MSDQFSIRSRSHFRSAKANPITENARKRQQPGFRCSSRVMCPVYHVTGLLESDTVSNPRGELLQNLRRDGRLNLFYLGGRFRRLHPMV